MSPGASAQQARGRAQHPHMLTAGGCSTHVLKQGERTGGPAGVPHASVQPSGGHPAPHLAPPGWAAPGPGRPRPRARRAPAPSATPARRRRPRPPPSPPRLQAGKGQRLVSGRARCTRAGLGGARRAACFPGAGPPAPGPWWRRAPTCRLLLLGRGGRGRRLGAGRLLLDHVGGLRGQKVLGVWRRLVRRRGRRRRGAVQPARGRAVAVAVALRRRQGRKASEGGVGGRRRGQAGGWGAGVRATSRGRLRFGRAGGKWAGAAQGRRGDRTWPDPQGSMVGRPNLQGGREVGEPSRARGCSGAPRALSGPPDRKEQVGSEPHGRTAEVARASERSTARIATLF